MAGLERIPMASFLPKFTSKYSHLIMILFLVFLLFPFMEDVKSEVSLISIACFLVVTFSLRALQVSMTVIKSIVIFGLAAIALDIILLEQGSYVLKHIAFAISLILYIIFLMGAIYQMVRAIFSSTKVTNETIQAGISIYLLTGFLFTLFYNFILIFDQNAFHFSEMRNDIYIMYYSFTTLTTVGYGDIVPINKFAMILSNLEAIFGQLFLGVFVARLVGMHIIHQHKP